MVIPSINCPGFTAAAKKIEKAEAFLPSGKGWIHIDVEDGRFTPHITWGDPQEYKSLNTNLNLEVHLMVQDPEAIIESWLLVGAKRIVVHLQTIKDPSFVLDAFKSYGAEAVLSLDPSMSAESSLVYLKRFKFLQVLSVLPGPNGQKFRDDSLDKIKFLRERSPTATIEVDGGINDITGRLSKEAGADILVSGHYIFESPDPKGAYERLSAI